MKARPFFLFALILLSISIFAQMPKSSTPVLKKGDVENFIAHFKSIESDFNALDIDYKPESDLEASIAQFNDIEEINKMVKKYGYKDFADFSKKTWTITACYASIKIESESVPELQHIQQQIEADENLTPEQKNKALEQLSQGLAGMQKAFSQSTNEEDVELVKPFMKKLDTLFEEE